MPRLAILNMPDASLADHFNKAPRALRRAPHSTNPCTHCPAYCCQKTVALTMVEAQRMALTLAMDVQRVAEPFAADPASLGDCAPAPVLLDEGPRFLRLVRRLDTLHCTFWVDVAGVGRCGVYPLRPHVCAVFPVHFQQGSTVVRMGNQSPCPTQWLQTPQLARSVEEHHARWKKDRALETRLLRAWHASPGTNRSFHAYAAFSQALVARWLRLAPPEPPPSAANRGMKGSVLMPRP